MAVVLWPAGNQAMERTGGADMIVTPPSPLRMAQRWQDSVKNSVCVVKDLDGVRGS